MNKKQLISFAIVLALGTGFTLLALKNKGDHGHDAPAAEAAKGPHGGRLLSDGDFATEVTIFERGVPPEFRVFFYEKNQPIDPAVAKVTIELHRFGGRVD